MDKSKKKRSKGVRSDKRIQVTYVDGRKPDGKPNKKFFYGKTRSEAEAKRKAYIDEKRAGLSHKDRELTVNEWVDRWISMYSIDAETYAPYIQKLRTDFGKQFIRGICEGELVKSLADYTGRSYSSASKYRMILKQVFHRAYKNHVIQDDPAEDLELPTVTSGTHRALERWEIDCIAENWQVYCAGRWAMLMLFCGLRRGEMIALDWQDIDLEKRIITVQSAVAFKKAKKVYKQTKTQAGMRKLPICDQLFEMLSATPAEQRKGPVCLSATGKPISHDSVRKNWATYCKAMTRILNDEEPLVRGRRKTAAEREEEIAFENYMKARASGMDVVRIPKYENRKMFDCRQHDLRHTFATMLFEAGVADTDAQYYLGHKDLRMTQELYRHLSEERKNETRSRITGYLDEYLKKGH